MSGGSDFDPEVAGELLVSARADNEIVQTELAQATAPQPEVAPTGTVSRASLDLVSFEVASGESEQAPVVQAARATPTLEGAEIKPAEQTDISVIAPDVELVGVAALNNVDLPDITFAGLTASASSDAVTPAQDVRTVSGSLVNMRSGPGTDFEVVEQLRRNTRVEVLTDAGNGWVQLRTLDGNATGWMADFLLSGG